MNMYMYMYLGLQISSHPEYIISILLFLYILPPTLIKFTVYFLLYNKNIIYIIIHTYTCTCIIMVST